MAISMNLAMERAGGIPTQGAPTAGDLLTMMRARRGFRMRAYMHVERDSFAPSYQRDRAVFTLKVAHEAHEGARETIASIDLPGWLGSGYADGKEVMPRNGDFGGYTRFSRDESNRYSPDKGSFHFLEHRMLPILRLLPKHATISFRVRLDNYDQGPCAEHGIHVDCLDMVARWMRGKREHEATFCIVTDVGAHNTARFGAPGWGQ